MDRSQPLFLRGPWWDEMKAAIEKWRATPDAEPPVFTTHDVARLVEHIRYFQGDHPQAMLDMAIRDLPVA